MPDGGWPNAIPVSICIPVLYPVTAVRTPATPSILAKLGGVNGSAIKSFVEASLKLAERGALPFDLVLFDPRFRLLSGRFKWFRDTQTYGTPTTWVLTPRLDVIGPPFFMNVYESEGRKLRYGADDIAALIDRVLGQ